ncbi:MAG: multidrug efflux SMR transporter [Ghiorsea sp.]|nr:multidrug efflux SMR transporter [Ghiorsea sp.]MDQ7059481.1 multidrug efflux SMR transporter [Ghiorsea sp.]
MQHWFFLISAILLEVAGTTAMKFSEGFTKIVPSVLMAVLFLSSLAMLTLALKKFEVGMAYAIWSGLGTALIAILGIYLFNETANMMKFLSILLIIAGVVGLNLSGAKH